MFEASRLHSLSEAGAHKPFFSSLVPLFAVEAVLDQFSGKDMDSSSIFDVLLWVTFPGSWVLDVSVQVSRGVATETGLKCVAYRPS